MVQKNRMASRRAMRITYLSTAQVVHKMVRLFPAFRGMDFVAAQLCRIYFDQHGTKQQ
jgi:hypothetical protein